MGRFQTRNSSCGLFHEMMPVPCIEQSRRNRDAPKSSKGKTTGAKSRMQRPMKSKQTQRP